MGAVVGVNPADHSASDEAERRGWPFVSTPEERIEAELLAATAGDEEAGAWLLGERVVLERPLVVDGALCLGESERVEGWLIVGERGPA